MKKKNRKILWEVLFVFFIHGAWFSPLDIIALHTDDEQKFLNNFSIKHKVPVSASFQVEKISSFYQWKVKVDLSTA